MMGKEGWQLGRGFPPPQASGGPGPPGHSEAPGPLGLLPFRDRRALQGRALPGAGLRPRMLA